VVQPRQRAWSAGYVIYVSGGLLPRQVNHDMTDVSSKPRLALRDPDAVPGARGRLMEASSETTCLS